MRVAFEQAGGRLMMRRFVDPADLAGLRESVIVNCAGLGAGALCGDGELVPVKGQLLRLRPQPQLHYGTSGTPWALRTGASSEALYMLPRSDAVVLGGTSEHGVASLAPDAAQTARILAGHAALHARAAPAVP
jgi:D-amino-acid oxidase